MESLVDNTLTDKNTGHSYLPVYEQLFSPFRDTCKNLLEVGVFDGGSIKLWEDYFPKANIYGLDLDLRRNKFTPRTHRVHILQADAYSPSVVGKFEPESFDAVIDDGWHTLDSMCLFAALYINFVRPGGYLIIEDLQHPSWADEIKKFLPSSMVSRVEDRRHVKGRHDDIMFIVQKPTNPN
jgi:hypothetical protein